MHGDATIVLDSGNYGSTDGPSLVRTNASFDHAGVQRAVSCCQSSRKSQGPILEPIPQIPMWTGSIGDTQDHRTRRTADSQHHRTRRTGGPASGRPRGRVRSVSIIRVGKIFRYVGRQSTYADMLGSIQGQQGGQRQCRAEMDPERRRLLQRVQQAAEPAVGRGPQRHSKPTPWKLQN
jgi:hypothetical protein